MPPKKESNKLTGGEIIRYIYLYLISAISFIVFIIGAVSIVDVGIKVFILEVPEYDYYETRPMMICERFMVGPEGEAIDNPNYEDCIADQKAGLKETDEDKPIFSTEYKRRIAIGIAQVAVAFPLWLMHWRIIERDRREKYALKKGK